MDKIDEIEEYLYKLGLDYEDVFNVKLRNKFLDITIKEEILDVNELAFDFLKEIIAMDKSIIENRYNIEIYDDMETIEVLEAICESRKYVLKGNELDYDRCCKAIINDFKQARLGNLTLETVKDVNKLIKKTKVPKESKN